MGAIGQARDAEQAATITRLLNEATTGNARASAELLPLVYEQLRALARRKMRAERTDHTLQATALVHEAYLRVVGNNNGPKWDGRGHFFAAAAQAMRRILVDSARRRDRLKRGGGHQRSDLDDVVELVSDCASDELLALDEALDRLAHEHPDKAELVKLRYFAGLTIAQAAEALGISTATAERRWAFARAWLYREMNK